MAKFTLEEKRRQSIYRQLYGKQTSYSSKKISEVNSKVDKQLSIEAKPTITKTIQVVDSNYLSTDLLKIFIFSSIAVVIQLSLFFAQRNHMINLSF